MRASAAPIPTALPATNPYKLGTSHISAGPVSAVSLSHFVAKFFNILKVPSMVVNSGRDKNATKDQP
jgi:hypothetical protein